MAVRSLFMIAICCVIWGCASNEDVENNKGSKKLVHGEQSSHEQSKSMVSLLKDNKLSDYTNLTIGAAFDSYKFLEKKEWKESRSQNGKFYIDFTGWAGSLPKGIDSLKSGVSARGVNVKFVVNPGGEYYVTMISKLEARTDGKLNVVPFEDKKRILDAIYLNKEIVF